MTIETKGYQIVLAILAGVAAKFFMVNFKVCHRTAELAAPAVSPQYVLAELLVILLLKPDRHLFGRICFTGPARLRSAETLAADFAVKT